MSPLKPDWYPAVIDGEPTELINLDAAALMVFDAPMGVEAALAKLKGAMPEDFYAELEQKVRSVS